MKPVSETPTEPTDYAAISLVYAALLSGVAASGRGRERIDPVELVPLSAATFALSKLVSKEKAETWMRAPFVHEHADGPRPKGRGLRYAIGELLSCTRCMGAWSALGLIALRVHAPRTANTVVAVLAASAGNDFLQSAFAHLCARADLADETATQLRRDAQPVP